MAAPFDPNFEFDAPKVRSSPAPHAAAACAAAQCIIAGLSSF